MSSAVARHPIHRALHRPALLLGAERELMLLTMLVLGGLAVTAGNLVAMLVSLALWIAASALLRGMAKADARLSRIYLRHLSYRHYYPARSRPRDV